MPSKTFYKVNQLRVFLLFVLLSASVSPVMGQAAGADTAFVRESLVQARQVYRNAIGLKAHLYSGQEYVDYRKLQREGHQFFRTDEFLEGTVLYDEIAYDSILLLYDVLRDELVIRQKNSVLKQKLLQEKVERFTLQGHRFVRFNKDSVANTNLTEGFYDLLFQKDVLLLAKRQKTMDDKHDNLLLIQEFTPADLLYIRKNNQYHQVSRKRHVYVVLKDKKRELKKFARAKRLNFREQKEASFLALVQHYSSLTE